MMKGLGRWQTACGGALLAAVLGCESGSSPAGPALALSAEQLNFGDVSVGHPQSLSVTVWNEGDELLTVDEVTTSGDGFSTSFSLASLPVLGPGEGGWIDVWFEPEGEGPAIGSLAVHSNDPDDPIQQVTFLGVGVMAALTVDVEGSLVFGPSAPGEVAYESVSLSSVGDAPAQLLAAELASGATDFWIDSVHPPAPTVLEPGESAVVVIGYSPGGGALDTLHLVSDVPSQPVIEVLLVGGASQSAPVCEILLPAGGDTVEGSTLDLVAATADGETASADLVASWADLFDGEQQEVCSVTPDGQGQVACEHLAQGVGPHTLTFRVEDPDGLTCEDQRVVVVTEDDPPQASVTTPAAPQVVGDGTCLEFEGLVHDDEDGDSLEISWWSDHPDVPDAFLAGWSAPDGSTSVTVCDLPCGEQVIYLTVVDAGGQVAADGVYVEVTLLEPDLDGVPDRNVVLGQQVEFAFSAVGSCGLTPAIQISGEPPDSVVSGDGFTYLPTFDPADNPVGVSFAIEVVSEISFDSDTRTDSLTFELTVVSDEFVAVGGEQASHIQLFPGLYDGTFGGGAVAGLQADLRPVAVGDLNGDGAADLLTADVLDAAWVLLRDDLGEFATVPLPLFIDGPATLGDFDGDGWVDLLVLDALGNGTTYLNRTDPLLPDDVVLLEVAGSVQLAPLGEVGEPIIAASAVDHDGDGMDDLVVAYPDPVSSPLYLGLASAVDIGAFEAPALWAETVPANALAQGIFGADAEPDLLVGGAGVGDPGQVYLLEGDGNLGLFGAIPAWDANPAAEQGESDDIGVSEFWPMDVDHDGCLDSVVSFVSEQGIVQETSLGVVFQDVDMVASCLGTFGSGDAEPDVFTTLEGQPEVAVPHVP